MLDRIFSVKNEDCEGKIYKVFNILGLKMKFFSLKKNLKKQIEKTNISDYRINQLPEIFCKNIITLLCEINHASELICVRSEDMVFILSRDFFKCDRQLFLIFYQLLF